MPTSFEKRRAELGDRLRRLRVDAGYETGKDFAKAIGWNAPKVSKIENGRQTVGDDDLDTWIAAVGGPPELAAQLREQLVEVRDAHASWKDKVRDGHRARQEESIAREARAMRIRAIDLRIVSGLLQTPEYARHTLLAHARVHGGGQDITEAVRARMQRQQILYEPGRTIELLTSEAALRYPNAPREVMVAQVHKLLALLGTPNIRFGIIPADVVLPYPVTADFWVVDDVAMVETPEGEHIASDADPYNEVADLLWTVAAEGEAARAVLLRVLDSLTRTAPPG
ncbi:helix-turn-helix domain-containing protein [Amycolatopsis silviterrae]|uniref:Helix-turn-helix domain-containing protein n=1 Tax=Amycolatopsis silviterrae TaxID=1656914 RepID=A0ABW5H074_9PSEU